MTMNEQETKRSANDETSTGLHFLFVTIPVTGHVNPLLPVARKLIDTGNEVRWYTGSRFRQRIEATGAAFEPYRTARDLDYNNYNETFPERAQLKGLAQGKWDLMNGVDMAVEQMDDLSGILDEHPASALVGDSMSLSALLIAQKRKLPVALVNALHLFAPSVDTAPDGLVIAPSATFAGRLRNRLLNWFAYHVMLREVSTYLREACVKVGLPPMRETFFEVPIRRSDLFLQPTVPAFEYPRSDLPAHVHFVGALLPDGAAEFTEPDWWSELDNDRPVVLVTQGTIATDFNDLLIPALESLADEDVLVIATTGNKSLEGVGQDSLPENVHLEPFIPYSDLMPHVDVMVTNGGYGGTHYALVHGVPLVAAGTTEDKAETCARIAWSGVGVNLKTDTPTQAQIRNAVHSVLTNQHYKEKARAMQAEFAQHDGPAEAAAMLTSLAG